MAQKEPWHQSKGWYHFVRSNYITWGTDWLMGLASKLAEIVLYATVLYSCAELYPGVTLPAGLNLAVFLLQMGAVDVGSIGLNKLAKQARKDGNTEGAKKAETLSRWLIGIMIASIVTASLELAISRITAISANQTAQMVISVVQIIVELVLVVARAVCAVLYGKVIHALKSDAPETVLVPTKAADLNTLIQQQFQPAFQQLANLASLIQKIETETESRFQKLQSESAASTEKVTEALSTLPAFSSRLTEIESAFQFQLKEMNESVLKLQNKTERQPTATPRPTKQHTEKASTTKPIPNIQAQRDRKVFVFQCLTEDPSMKIEDIRRRAESAGISISTGTVSSYRSEFQKSKTETEARVASS